MISATMVEMAGFIGNAVGATLAVARLERNPSVFLFAKQTKIHLLPREGFFPPFRLLRRHLP